jgi:linoleoyl-CoA desaturase
VKPRRSSVAFEAIGEMPSFAAKSEFWTELRMRGSEYLASQGQPSTGDPRALRQAAVILLWFALSYGALLCATSLGLALLAALSCAFAAAAVGFGVFHDANHGTLFRRSEGNVLAARLCSILLGPSRHLWVRKHGYHHRHANVFGWDDDLETRGLLRLSPAYAWQPRFRRQELKAILYYGLNTMEWVFWKDFRSVAKGRLNKWHPLKLDREEEIEFVICKALYLILLFLPPFIMLPFWWAIAAFILFHLVFGWVLAAVFQVAHLTLGMGFDGVRAGDDWAMHQVRTSANFATHSRFITWFTAGLNHQLEHHLFPNVAHTHYSGLRPIVRAVAQRHGLECHELGSLPSAVGQHFALLKSLGTVTL